jgi:GT2 family glycosyltransferase
VRIWHNGPSFPPPAVDGADLFHCGENLGFGEGVNRLLEHVEAEHAVVANPDLDLDERCIERLWTELAGHPRAMVAAAALASGGPDRRVNAYGQRLTADYLGICPDRGRSWPAFLAQARDEVAGAPERYLGPSGALFALNCSEWRARIGGPLFLRSFFLYMEDVALWIRLRLRGAEIRFCPAAWASHAWSASTGQRSATKLYHVERNRLWLLRALFGMPRAAALLSMTALRYAAYVARAGGVGAGGSGLAKAIRLALTDGLRGAVPAELGEYFRGCDASALPSSFFASLREQLASPVE